MSSRIKAPALSAVAALALGGCVFDLDVGNPNNLLEESIRKEEAAEAVVNGSLSLVSTGISSIWQPYLVASDEFYWIGSRDAWGQLDQGFVGNTENEFTDGAFPDMTRAAWMSREAVEILTDHLAETPSSTRFAFELARAQLYYGMMLMVIGEVQEDIAFSDKKEEGPPVGPANMFQVLDDAIAQLDAAVTAFTNLGETAFLQRATAVRARAQQSRAIWNTINPVAATPALVNAGGADANTVITMAGGVTADWNYDLLYSSTSQSNPMAGWVNDRKENQIDQSLVTVNAANDITGIRIQDPIDNVDDPALIRRIQKWKGTSSTVGAVTDKGGVYPPMTIASTRLMHLILAENALQQGQAATFETHINHIRAMDGLTAFSDANPLHPTNQAMLEHTRRMNTVLMGLRLADMYRWSLAPNAADGTITAATWSPNSDAVKTPGCLLPITIIEIRANSLISDSGC